MSGPRCAKLIDVYPRRVAVVVTVKGDSTKYCTIVVNEMYLNPYLTYLKSVWKTIIIQGG